MSVYDISLSQIETNFLAKGLNFAVSSKKFPNKDVIVTSEDVAKYLEKGHSDTIYAQKNLAL